MEFCMHFDGGADPNPGKAGAGAVIYKNGEEFKTASVYVGEKETNNTAEYVGLIEGLKLAFSNDITNLVVKGDSQLVIKQMKGEYKVKAENLKILQIKAKLLAEKFENIEFIHIKRELNKRADELATLGRDKDKTESTRTREPEPAPILIGPICRMFDER
tara:strand:- start:52 stop:531 length:480 start_codon:yes stop_codon:yes gene_type:complete